MIKIYPNTVVYVLAPAQQHSGGPELLHQLAVHLLHRGVDVRMYYVPQALEDPVDDFYKGYHVPYTRTIIDQPENIIIFPEVATGFMHNIHQMQRILWWMSVDNWLKDIMESLRVYMAGGTLAAPVPRGFLFQADTSLIHWVQSEYARQFLQVNGIAEQQVSFVGDYLNPVFLENSRKAEFQEKKNLVAFNPAKGLAFTQKLIMASQDIQWCPIQNMTPAEVEALLGTAKVYVDFGNHPGRDRIPREAVVSGCCLITSRKGAAQNAVDIPIEDSYKFDAVDENIPRIIAKIRALLENYPQETRKLAAYRKIIRQEPATFAHDVDAAFGIAAQTEQLCEKFEENNAVRGQDASQQNLAENLWHLLEKYEAEILKQRGADAVVCLCQPIPAIQAEIREAFPLLTIRSLSTVEYGHLLRTGEFTARETYDYILAGSLLEETQFPEKASAELLRGLRACGKVYLSFGNIRHWSVWQELLEGHWRYNDIGIRRRGVCHFFTMNEIRQLFVQAGYKNLQINRIFRSGNPALVQHLQELGAVDTQDELNTEFFLLAACNANPDEYDRGEFAYTGEVYQELAYLLRRLEYDIDIEANTSRLWAICAEQQIAAEELLDFLQKAVLQPAKVLQLLAKEIEHGTSAGQK